MRNAMPGGQRDMTRTAQARRKTIDRKRERAFKHALKTA